MSNVEGTDPDQIGVPQENPDAVNVVEPGGSPESPDADTVYEPGGSPSDETVEMHDPTITTLTPATAAIGADATVTVAGTNFRDNSVVEADQSPVETTYVSDTELTATLTDPGVAGAVTVSVRNEVSQMESNSVDFTWTAAAGRSVRTGHIREDSK